MVEGKWLIRHIVERKASGQNARVGRLWLKGRALFLSHAYAFSLPFHFVGDYRDK